MGSINLTKMLSVCKVLRSNNIVSQIQCTCHNNLNTLESLEILIDGPEPIFRCFLCGFSYCVPSYLSRVLELSDDEIINSLMSCGFSKTESDQKLARSKKYLRFISEFELGRHVYRNNIECDNRRVKSFGDWSQLNGGFINSIFFRKTTSKLNQKTDYSLLMLRDENGIPSRIQVYTLLGSYIGEAKIQIPTGNISILSERWTDFVSWTGKLTITDNSNLASVISRSMVDSNGVITSPVCVIVNSVGPATFFSRSNPFVRAIIGEDSSSNAFSCMRDKNTQVHVYRLPGSGSSLISSYTQKIEEEIERISPTPIAKDICSKILLDKESNINSFCREVSLINNSTEYFQNELIELYCIATGLDKNYVSQHINTLSSGVNNFNVCNKKFKIYNGGYHEIKQDYSFSRVSNFWISIKSILSIEDEPSEYDCTLYINDKMVNFFVSHKEMYKPGKLLNKIISICALNNCDFPIWNSGNSVLNALPQIVMGLNMQKITSIKKDVYGFYNEQFITEKWKCDKITSICSEYNTGSTKNKIKYSDNLQNKYIYRDKCIKQITEMCSTDYGALIFRASLEFVNKMIKNNDAHLIAKKQIARDISMCLGLVQQEDVVNCFYPQFCEKIINHKLLLKNNFTISLYSSEETYSNRFINVMDGINPSNINNLEPIIYFLVEELLTGNYFKFVKKIENFLGNNSYISKFRNSINYLNNAQNRLNEFFGVITTNSNFRDFIKIDNKETRIYVKVFSALSKFGFNFSKTEIIKDLINSGYKIDKSAKDNKDQRKTYIAIYSNNQAQQQWKKNTTKRNLKI
jgi:hypothetical protein